MFDPALVIVGGAVAGLALLIFLLVRYGIDRRRARIEQRLGKAQESGILAHGVPARMAVPGRGWSGWLDRAFDGLIQRTGLGWQPAQALGVVGLSAVGLETVLYLWRDEIWMAAVGLIVGAVVPLVIFQYLQRRRQRILQEQLPDAFYFLARSLRAGQTLDKALDQAGQAVADPLASEFRRCAGQIHLGLQPAAALQTMAERLRLLDFDIFVSTVALYYRVGGNLSLLLDRMAACTRDRNQFRGFFLAATAQGRTTALVIGCAMPVMLIVYAIWQPEHTSTFFTSPLGWQAIGIASVLEVIGVAWVFSILRMDY